MSLTPDEQRALAFVAALLLLSAAVRIGALPEPMPVPDSAGFDFDAHIAATGRAVAERERRDLPLEDGERIDPNAASAVELDRLPGVGPELAGRIVEARQSARFRTAAELVRVPGIGERTADRLAPHLTLPATSASTPGTSGGEGPDRRIDLNTASADALTALPGIGPVLAARIVAHRERAGPFISVDSLLAVKGIGPATLERLRTRIRVR